jgi:hypothetical protein
VIGLKEDFLKIYSKILPDVRDEVMPVLDNKLQKRFK